MFVSICGALSHEERGIRVSRRTIEKPSRMTKSRTDWDETKPVRQLIRTASACWRLFVWRISHLMIFGVLRAAMVAVATKLLRVAWACMKHGHVYDADRLFPTGEVSAAA